MRCPLAPRGRGSHRPMRTSRSVIDRSGSAASASASSRRPWVRSAATSSSAFEGKWAYSAPLLTPAVAAISATPVPSYPRSPKTSAAARTNPPRGAAAAVAPPRPGTGPGREGGRPAAEAGGGGGGAPATRGGAVTGKMPADGATDRARRPRPGQSHHASPGHRGHGRLGRLFGDRGLRPAAARPDRVDRPLVPALANAVCDAADRAVGPQGRIPDLRLLRRGLARLHRSWAGRRRVHRARRGAARVDHQPAPWAPRHRDRPARHLERPGPAQAAPRYPDRDAGHMMVGTAGRDTGPTLR